MAIRNEFPQYAPCFSIEGLAVGKKAISNYNLLIGRYPGADGMKTGFVCPSGFNMIGSATRDGPHAGRRRAWRKIGGQPRRDRRRGCSTRVSWTRPAAGSTVAALPAYGDTMLAQRHAWTRSATRRSRQRAVRGRTADPARTCPNRPIRKSSTMCRRWSPSALGGATGPIAEGDARPGRPGICRRADADTGGPTYRRRLVEPTAHGGVKAAQGDQPVKVAN